jgi:hypothetical protein
VIERFTPGWLAIREPLDAAARRKDLAQRFVAALPKRPRLLDLGAGTGSMFRYLAPLIGGPQSWLLVDRDRASIEDAVVRIARWAGENGWQVTLPRRAMIVHTKTGAWRVEIEYGDLIDRRTMLALDGADGVVCSALLDIVSAAWIARLAGRLHSPFLATLTVDGRRTWMPRHRQDRLIARGFVRSQTREKGFGPALGPHAARAAAAALRGAGFAVREAAADWLVPSSAASACRSLILGEAIAATTELRRSRAAIEEWERARFDHLRTRRLAIRIGHRDILALPGEDTSHAAARRRRR